MLKSENLQLKVLALKQAFQKSARLCFLHFTMNETCTHIYSKQLGSTKTEKLNQSSEFLKGKISHDENRTVSPPA